jgi:hypothetical protein
MKGVCGENHGAFLAGRGIDVIGELDCAACADRPGRRKLQERIARIVGGRRRSKRRTVPGDGQGSRLKAPARKPNIERVKLLVAYIFQMIFGGDVNPRLGLRQESDLNRLLFDDVAGAE